MAHHQKHLAEYEWIVVFGVLASLWAAWGIGANDVANAYATSVGSRALTIKQACALAVVFEFLGAFLAGNAVADTIRKGIAETKCFEGSYMDAALLMYGNLCVVAMVGFWLYFASWAEMPVSTTHSAVGGMVGMTIAIKGSSCVVWWKNTDAKKIYIPGGVMGIVLSWFFSPLLSAFFAVCLYLFVRTVILRSKNSFNRAIYFYPLLIILAVWINSFFVISKGIAKSICKDWDKNKSGPDTYILCHGNGVVRGWIALGFCGAFAIVIALCCIPLIYKMRQYVLDEMEAKQNMPEEGKKDEPEAIEKPANNSIISKVGIIFTKNLNFDVHHVVTDGTNQKTEEIHANAEKYDPATEAVFRYIQIFTAILDSFAHGANDVANAMGPFMAIYATYNSGGWNVGKKVDTADDGRWILALGGIGIGLGLLMYGYKIMRAIGVKLAVITPSRGFAIELGAAIVIIIGSYLGLPLSTTHCQVGATTGVALFEGSKGVNWKVLLKTAFGWVITLIVVGGSAGLLTAQGIHAPLASGNCDHHDDGTTCNFLPAHLSPQDIFLENTCPRYMAERYISGEYDTLPERDETHIPGPSKGDVEFAFKDGLHPVGPTDIFIQTVGDWRTGFDVTIKSPSPPPAPPSSPPSPPHPPSPPSPPPSPTSPSPPPVNPSPPPPPYSPPSPFPGPGEVGFPGWEIYNPYTIPPPSPPVRR